MTEFTAAQFEEVCAAEPVKSQIDGIEMVRAAAVKQFWMVMVGGGLGVLVLAVLAGIMLHSGGIGAGVFIVCLVGVLIFAFRPVEAARRGLKQPMLTALALRGGLEYVDSGFEPPFYMGVRKSLFGSWLSEQTFTDLFRGRDEAGKPFAIYEAHLQQGSGKNRTTVFQGQMYGFGRAGGAGVTVITPDKGLFNFFKPEPGMQRIKFEANPEFEKRFEVYSTNPGEATSLLASPTLQNRLLELRGKGKVFAYVGPEEALIAITGGDRFEPGSMFKATDGRDRARMMFDDVCGSLAILKELRAAFG
ncbi:MAG: DUF3137 domain-containing protein [Caulobacteraceae bacterium]|nr:DUF3137 domain-containing protein [Caulobacteraceae bacterium]